MQASQSIYLLKAKSRIILLDLFLLGIIYITPALTHMFSIPVYVIEPMRLAMFACILFTNKSNAILIAATLPIFSLVTSGHPVFAKALLMSVELTVNVLLYYQLNQKFSNQFLTVAASILMSKILYYIVKYLTISAGLLSMELISTSIAIQLIVMIATAGSVYAVLKIRCSE